MTIVEEFDWNGRHLTVTWRAAPFVPPRELVTQACGVCFDGNGKIILVSVDGETWQLVGGHPEAGETIEAAFIREAAEEACATVTELAYLGAQEMSDPQNPGGLATYYHVRFWARVMLGEFVPEHETVARKGFEPATIQAALNWQTRRVLDAILKAALEHERGSLG